MPAPTAPAALKPSGCARHRVEPSETGRHLRPRHIDEAVTATLNPQICACRDIVSQGFQRSGHSPLYQKENEMGTPILPAPLSLADTRLGRRATLRYGDTEVSERLRD